VVRGRRPPATGAENGWVFPVKSGVLISRFDDFVGVFGSALDHLQAKPFVHDQRSASILCPRTRSTALFAATGADQRLASAESWLVMLSAASYWFLRQCAIVIARQSRDSAAIGDSARLPLFRVGSTERRPCDER